MRIEHLRRMVSVISRKPERSSSAVQHWEDRILAEGFSGEINDQSEETKDAGQYI